MKAEVGMDVLEKQLKAARDLDNGLMSQIRNIEDVGVKKILLGEARREFNDIVAENIRGLKVRGYSVVIESQIIINTL